MRPIFQRMFLLSGVLLTLATAGSLAAADKSDKPLVLAFEHCGYFEFVVDVGEDFHFVAMNDQRRMVVSGRVLSLKDGKCRLRFSIDYCGLGGHGAAHGVNQPAFTLPVGEPPYGSHGTGPFCPTTGPWIRRGLDPVPSLKKALARGGKSFYAAAAALRRLGPHGAEAVPELIDALQGELEIPPDAVGPPFQEFAARTLAAMGSAAGQAVPALLEVKDADELTRVAVAVALWKIDHHPDAIPRLIQLLHEGSRDTRRAVLVALEKDIGAAAAQYAPAIKKFLDSDKPWLRQSAAAALWSVRRDRAAIDVHIEGLQNEAMKGYAASRLGRIGPAAAKAVPALIDALLDGGHQSTQRIIIKALANIDPAAQQTLPILRAIVRENPADAGKAGQALAGMGPSVLPVLQRMMMSDDPGLRQMGRRAMFHAGPAAVPYLAQLLGHPSNEVCEAAAYCLDNLGPKAAGAIPALINCLTSDRPEIPDAVGFALVEMGQAAVGPLQQLRDHEKKRVRQIAKYSLKVINATNPSKKSKDEFVDCFPD